MHNWNATIALSGGGARGLAHLGAIEVLVKSGLHADRVVGVSIGGLAGAMYAFDPDIARVEQHALDYLRSAEFAAHQKHLSGARSTAAAQPEGPLRAGYHRLSEYLRANLMLHRAVSQSSLLPGDVLAAVVDHLLPDADITDARIPLTIVAVDLHTGRPVTLEHGPLRLAVRASASVPGIFPPVPFEDRLLCDIAGFFPLARGVGQRYSPERLVAIDVDTSLRPLSASPTALDILIRINDIGASLFREHLAEEADLVILPDVGHVPWFDFRTADAMINAGRVAARTALSNFTPPRSWLRRLFTPRGAVRWNGKHSHKS